MTDVQGRAPGITHEPPERVDEVQQVLEDEGDLPQYANQRSANQIKELSTHFKDFTAAVSLAAGKAAIRIWHPPTADPLIP